MGMLSSDVDQSLIVANEDGPNFPDTKSTILVTQDTWLLADLMAERELAGGASV
jgi:hypothetical protein